MPQSEDRKAQKIYGRETRVQEKDYPSIDTGTT
jgi:hypothetical protein